METNAKIPPAERSAIGYQDRGFYIPERMAAKLDGYIQRGEETGHFLTALICDNLHETVARADAENLANLPAFCSFLYNYAPSLCHGSKQKMENWIAAFQKD